MYRREKLKSILGQELGRLITREVNAGALLTVTDVELSRKMDVANIFISILPEEKEMDVLALLNTRASDLRHALLKKLTIRVVPRLVFKIDAGAKNAAAVEQALLKEDN